MTANVSTRSAALIKPEPGRSSRRGAESRDSGTTHATMRMPATPIGTLTQKTDAHPNWLSSRPPTIGPPPKPIPAAAAQMPNADALRSGANVADRMESVSGATIAAPIPCSARKMMSARSSVDSAQAADITVKLVSPMSIKRRRP